MKIICTKKDTGKRLLVDTRLEPNYKNDYNNEFGKPFCEEVVAPEVVVESFECNECEKTYKSESSLKGHITKKHG